MLKTENPKDQTTVRFNKKLKKAIDSVMHDDPEFPFDSDLIFVNLASFRLKKEWENTSNKKRLAEDLLLNISQMEENKFLNDNTKGWN